MASPARALQRLRAVRSVYGVAAEREKRALLRELRACRFATHAQLDALHDDLLFLCAFGGSHATTAQARRLLSGIAARLRALPRTQRARADDSGMAGSSTRHVFPYPVARWLARAAPGDVEIAWREFAEPSRLDPFLTLTMHDAEREAFDSGEFATRAWVRVARRIDARTDLEWMMATPSSAALAARHEAAWDDAEVPLEWRLADSRFATTHNKVAGVGGVARSGLRRPANAAEHAITTPLPGIERLSGGHARRVVA